MDSKAGKRYMRAIGKGMACTAPVKRMLLHDMSENVSEFCAANPGTNVAALEAHFGKAEKIAADFMSGVDDAEIDRSRKRKKLVIGAVIAALAVLVIALAGVVRFYWYHVIDGVLTTVIYESTPAPDDFFDEDFVE